MDATNYFYNTGTMKITAAVAALSAIAHEGRLSISRLLVQTGPCGMTVGEIAAKIDMPGPTLSFHLSVLKHAGLVHAKRDGRRLIQTADFKRMTSLLSYLTENCCGGNLAACMPSCEPVKATARKKAS